MGRRKPSRKAGVHISLGAPAVAHIAHPIHSQTCQVAYCLLLQAADGTIESDVCLLTNTTPKLRNPPEKLTSYGVEVLHRETKSRERRNKAKKGRVHEGINMKQKSRRETRGELGEEGGRGQEGGRY